MAITAFHATPGCAPFAQGAGFVGATAGDAQPRPTHCSFWTCRVIALRTAIWGLAVPSETAPFRRAFRVALTGDDAGALEACAAARAVDVRATSGRQGTITESGDALGSCTELPADGSRRTHIWISAAVYTAGPAGKAQILGMTTLGTVVTW